MKPYQGVLGLLFVMGAIAGVWTAREPAPGGWDLASIDRARVPQGPFEPTAAGRPLDLLSPPADILPTAQQLQPDDSGRPGSTVRGRVSRVVYRTQENVFVSADYTPTHLRVAERMFVEVEYPDRLRSGALSVLTRVDGTFADLRPGDVVDLRLAHRHDPRNFPVREVTRVTGLVARSDTALARAFDNRILARKSGVEAVAAVPGGTTLGQALGLPARATP